MTIRTSGKPRYESLASGGYRLTAPWQVNVGWREDLLGAAAKAPGVMLVSDGWLEFEDGYIWDGPSGPTIDTEDFMAGALAHDGLYELIRAGKLPSSARESADRVLYELCRQDGMSWFRAQYAHKILRLIGWTATRRSPKAEVRVLRPPTIEN